MNIDQFLVLDAVVKLGSFSAAARALNRVQSAVSYNIKTLEEELGLELFSRDTYRPSLTSAGESIYRKARELLLNVEEIERLSKSLTQGEEAEVSLDVTPTCELGGIAKALTTISQDFPHTRINMSMEVFGGEGLVLDEKADISITDVVQRDSRLELVPWQKVKLIPVISKRHPLASSAHEILSRAQIINHIQIVVGNKDAGNKNKSLGIMEGNQTWGVSDMSVKKALILHGLGWGNLPDYMVAQEIQQGELFALNLPDLPMGLANLQLVRLMHKARGPVANRLWDLLVQEARSGQEDRP